MSMSWKDTENKVNKGPFSALMIALLIGAVSVAGIWGVGTIFGWFGEVAQVAKEEFGPRAMLQKYEWFKNVAAELDKKKSDIQVYESRLTSMEADYDGIPRNQWDRTDKEQMSLWRTESAGVKASFNGLAAEYNAQMAKFNWSFANAGQLPQGATDVLPREFRTYTTD